MDCIRFLHAADLHLDAPFQSTNFINEKWTNRLTNATWDALNHFIQLALRKNVDFVIIAGDIFDKECGNHQAILRFKNKINKLSIEGIHTYIVLGNHDLINGSRLFRVYFEDDPYIHILSDNRVEEVIHIKNGKKAVKLYGRGFWDSDPYDNPTLQYMDVIDKHDEDMLKIGIAHGRVGEINEHLPCPSFSLKDLKNTNVHYWAMGHIHKRKVFIDELPLVINPGGIQGGNIYECGPMGCYYSKWKRNQLVKIQFHSLEAVRWEKLVFHFDEENNMNAATTIEGVEDLIREQLNEKYIEIKKPLIVQLFLEGKTSFYQKLRDPLIMESMMQNLSNDDVLIVEIIDHTIPFINLNENSYLKTSLEEYASLIDRLKSDESLYEMLEKEHLYLFGDDYFQKITVTGPNERGRGQWKVKKLTIDRRNWLDEAKKLGIDILLEIEEDIIIPNIIQELSLQQHRFFNREIRDGLINGLLRDYEKMDQQILGLHTDLIQEDKLGELQQEQYQIDGELFHAVKQWTLYSIAIFVFKTLDEMVLSRRKSL